MRVKKYPAGKMDPGATRLLEIGSGAQKML